MCKGQSLLRYLVADRFEAGSKLVEAISTCRDSSNLLEAQSQIPLCYLVADRFKASRRPVADLLARASSLLAS